MTQKAGIKLLDEEKYICNEKWFNWFSKQNNETKYTTCFEVLKDNYIINMKDLISHCLTYNYKINIPQGYKVTKIYTITLSTSNFDPEKREYSNTSTYGLFSSTDENYIKEKFKSMCKTRKEGNYKGYNSKRHYCWHTEDFAYNQIIHSYDISETYIVEEV